MEEQAYRRLTQFGAKARQRRRFDSLIRYHRLDRKRGCSSGYASEGKEASPQTWLSPRKAGRCCDYSNRAGGGGVQGLGECGLNSRLRLVLKGLSRPCPFSGGQLL